jgi:hypothetical protein
MVGHPVGLYYLLGVLMLIVAACCLSLLVASVRVRRDPGRDVEVSKVAMGTAMAGMFVPSWAFGPNVVWELIFLGLLIWFIVRSFESISLFGLHLPHTAIHGLMSFVMILMYWFPVAQSSGATSMSMGSGGPRIDPGLALVVAFVLFASAIFAVASPHRGATFYGTHCAGGGRPSPNTIDRPAEQGAVTTITVSIRNEVGGLLGNPSLLDASHVVMVVAMGFMLLLMI